MGGGRLTLYQREVEVVLIQFPTEDGERLALEQHGFLLEAREQLERAALHVCDKGREHVPFSEKTTGQSHYGNACVSGEKPIM